MEFVCVLGAALGVEFGVLRARRPSVRNYGYGRVRMYLGIGGIVLFPNHSSIARTMNIQQRLSPLKKQFSTRSPC